MIKSKYTMIMLKLIEAERSGDRNTINIEGTVEEFKEWFLERKKAKLDYWVRFTIASIECALKEIENQNSINFEELNTI